VVTPRLPIPEPAPAVIGNAHPERIGAFFVALAVRATKKKGRTMIDDQLRKACRDYGSQYSLAAAIGVNQSLLSRFLAGYDLRLETAAKLADYLGLELAPKQKRTSGRKGK